MTQILLYQSGQGIVLATDSHAVTAFSQEDSQTVKVQKLFHLTPQAVLVTGGAGYGLPLCQRFQSYVTQKGLDDPEEIFYYALPFFQSEMQSTRRSKDFVPPRPDLDRVYFLLAGYAHRGSENLFRFLLLGSEHSTDPLHVVQTGNIVAIPRQMGIEYRLSRLSPSETTLDEVESVCEQFLTKLSEKNDDVGPPFYFVRIASDGVQVRTLT